MCVTVGLLVFPAAATHKSVPALSLGEIDPYTLPPELKREGKDWLAVYNPGTERVLSVSLVHTLHHEGLVVPLSFLHYCRNHRADALFLIFSVVCCVQFSKDGQYLATGCNHTANIYDTKTGSRIWFDFLCTSRLVEPRSLISILAVLWLTKQQTIHTIYTSGAYALVQMAGFLQLGPRISPSECVLGFAFFVTIF